MFIKKYANSINPKKLKKDDVQKVEQGTLPPPCSSSIRFGCGSSSLKHFYDKCLHIPEKTIIISTNIHNIKNFNKSRSHFRSPARRVKGIRSLKLLPWYVACKNTRRLTKPNTRTLKKPNTRRLEHDSATNTNYQRNATNWKKGLNSCLDAEA